MYNQNTLSRRFDIKVKYFRQNKLLGLRNHFEILMVLLFINFWGINFFEFGKDAVSVVVTLVRK